MSEATFAAALLDPGLPVPDGLVRPDGQPAQKRFAVYRNNVAIGLTEALETGFPVTRKLVGAAFFAAMAGVFLRGHPPQGRIMMLYGADFPNFLTSFVPAASLPYLPDVARLEQGLRESYHAADALPLPPQNLAALPEARLLTARLTLAPALRLIRSDWPIHGIWRAQCQDGPAPRPGGEDVLILRPEFDPAPHLLPPGGGAFMSGLLTGANLAGALAAAPPEFDLAHLLALLLNGKAITGIAS